AVRDLATLRAKPRLPPGIARIITAEMRGESHLVPRALERSDQRARHRPIARRDGMVGRFQRRVEGDAHPLIIFRRITRRGATRARTLDSRAGAAGLCSFPSVARRAKRSSPAPTLTH